MSRRGLVPVALAVGLGIANGYITFNPAFQELEVQKLKNAEQLEAADLGPNMIEIPVKDRERKGNAPATTPGSHNIREDMTSQSLKNGDEPRPRSWWPFGG